MSATAKTSRSRSSASLPDTRDDENGAARASQGRPRWGPLAVAAVMLPAAMLYLPSLANPLIWDDELHVPLAASDDATGASGAAAGEYRRPLVLLSYAAQAWLGLGSSAALHGANAVLHAANAGLVVLVACALLPPAWTSASRALVACAAGLVFASHPVVSGSVAYVSGRTDLLSTLFLLLAILAVSRPPREESARSSPAGSPEAADRPAWATAGIAAAAVVASGLSKESGLAAGPLVAGVLWWRRSSGARGATRSRMAVAILAALATAAIVLPPAAGASMPLLLRLRGAGTALATYAGLLVRPHDLHLDRLTPLGPPAAAILGAIALVAAIVAIARFVRAPSRTLLAAVALAMLLAPGSGYVPVYPAIADRYVFTGEQFLYAPLTVLAVAFCVAVARTVEHLWPRLVPLRIRLSMQQRLASGGRPLFDGSPGAVAAMVAAMTLALAWMPAVLERQVEFSSAEQVYRKTLAHSPSPRACFNLGALHLARREYANALRDYEGCVKIAPADAAAHGQLAIALQQLGRTDDARRAYERSVALDERNARVWSNFATLDANAGRYDDARAKWQRALAIDPRESTAAEALRRLDGEQP